MNDKDKHRGQGGDFKVVGGQRVRDGDEPKREPEGGGARNKDGERIQDKPLKPEPAVPAPGRAPWETEPEVQKKKGA